MFVCSRMPKSISVAVITILISCLFLAGCQTTQRSTGTAIGAVVGAAAGAFFGKGAGKVVAIAAGALVGGFIGNQIGGYLDEQDQQAVERESAKALSQSADGEIMTWENPETKAKAEMKVEKTETITRDIPIVRHKSVEKPGKLKMIGEPYEILTDSNIRFGPSMDYDVAKVLKKGSVVLAVGQVQGRNWILVNQDRKAIGYIHASLVGEKGTLAAKAASKTTVKEAATVSQNKNDAAAEQIMRPAVDLDALEGEMQTVQALRPAVDLDAMVASYGDSPETDDLVAETVEVEAPARTMTMKVTTPEGEEETTVVATKGTDGAWEII